MYIINTLYYLIILNITQDIVAHCIDWPVNGQLKSRTKKCLESKNNAVDHTIFLVWLACQPGPY